MLARIRIEGGFARADNQNRVLCALRDKVTSPSVITKIPDLITSFQDAVQTDLSPAQLGQLACIGTKIQARKYCFCKFPRGAFQAITRLRPCLQEKCFRLGCGLRNTA